jgi:hypothetical protein
MKLVLARSVLFAAGFALWALTSALPMVAAVREGWDRPAYWQIGLPLVLAVQLLVALRSPERILIAPLWVLFGHVVAMLFIHPAGTGLGLLPLAIVVMGLPLYLLLLLADVLGRMVRRLTSPL